MFNIKLFEVYSLHFSLDNEFDELLYLKSINIFIWNFIYEGQTFWTYLCDAVDILKI